MEGWIATLREVAPVASAACSAAGLLFVGWQIRAAGRTADLQALRDISSDVREREAALISARKQGDDARDTAFLEYADFLEVLAAGCQKGLFRRVTEQAAREKLIDALALIETDQRWAGRLIEARSFDTTHRHLQDFRRKHSRAVERQKAALSGRA